MKKILNQINKASTAQEIEAVSEKISQFLLTASIDERAEIKLAISGMHQRLINQANELIEESKTHLNLQGKSYNLSDWITVKEYAKRYGIASTQVVSNWIRRGIVPKDNILEIGELNNLKLIKAVPYHEV